MSIEETSPQIYARVRKQLLLVAGCGQSTEDGHCEQCSAAHSALKHYDIWHKDQMFIEIRDGWFQSRIDVCDKRIEELQRELYLMRKKHGEEV